ncbi:MAG: DUF1573 domain-containing protein [bacterium]|nr:DUF1573 domain-containing protein [bacterium]
MSKNKSTKSIVPAIIALSVIVLFVGGLLWMARPDLSGAEPQDLVAATSLTVAEQRYDFGEISMEDGLVSHEYVVTNSSPEPVILSKMYTSCMCTQAELLHQDEVHGPFGMVGHGTMPRLDESIGPGEEFMVKAIYDPNAHGPAGVGPVDRVVSLETDSGELLELQLVAVVTP